MKELTSKQEDLILDDIREKANEIDDGSLDQYIEDNLKDLSAQFTQDVFISEFRDYCKEQFNEVNE